MPAKKVDIIVVNWNSGEMTLQAVAPYLGYSSSTVSCNVIVADNASADNSLDVLRDHVDNLVINTENIGFGKACNQVYKTSLADYILLLNPDTVSEPAVLEGLVNFLEKNPSYGIAGPAQVDKDGHIMKTCGRFPTVKTSFFEVTGLSKLFPKIFTPVPIMIDWDHGQSKEVDHVMGSYMLIRKSVLDKIGFMDEAYFVFMEDMDLSKRFKDAGFKTFYDTSRSIFHEGGGGAGQKPDARRLFYSMSSRRLYWKKYFGKFSYSILLLLSITIEPLLRMVDSLFKQKGRQLTVIPKAYSLYIRELMRP